VLQVLSQLCASDVAPGDLAFSEYAPTPMAASMMMMKISVFAREPSDGGEPQPQSLDASGFDSPPQHASGCFSGWSSLSIVPLQSWASLRSRLFG
jgi:hypothetical protein